MRQAERYLPEYHATHQKEGLFLNLYKTLELAIEVTMHPLSSPMLWIVTCCQSLENNGIASRLITV